MFPRPGPPRIMLTITAGSSIAARYEMPSCLRLIPGLEEEVMTRAPKSTSPDTLAAGALALMEKHAITNLVVLPEGGKGARKPLGIIHIHDILKAGVG